jgi:hypothetical protein
MDYLEISAVAFDHLPSNNFSPSKECNFEVAFNGGDFTAVSRVAEQPAVIAIPATPRPLPVAIRAKPTTKKHFAYNGRFSYLGDGNLVRVEAAPEFRPPRAINFQKPPGSPVASSSSVTLVFYLSRVSDKTDEVVFQSNDVPPNREAYVPGVSNGQSSAGWLDSWPGSKAGSANYIAADPVLHGVLQYSAQNIDPDSENIVFGVAGTVTPKLVAVSWPKKVERTLASKKTPFLVYFHAGMFQNSPRANPPGTNYEGPGQKPYPFGFDYLFFGLWKYMNYQGDPLLSGGGHYSKGIPYQVAAAGKDVVSILPESSVGFEVGAFGDAESAHDILREIDAFMYRRAGIYTSKGIGRTALAAFSSGNDSIRFFFKNTANHGKLFYTDILQEVYGFDPPHADDWVDAALKWAGASSEKIIRIYSQGAHKTYAKLVPHHTLTAPSVQTSGNSRSIALLPRKAWAAVRAPQGLTTLVDDDNDDPHQLISAVMLTDAIRRSKF